MTRRTSSDRLDHAPASGMCQTFDIQSVTTLLESQEAISQWCEVCRLSDPSAVSRCVESIAACGITLDLFASIINRLSIHLGQVSDPDQTLVSLDRFFHAVRNPLASAALFDRDPESLPILLKIFSAGPFLADLVIADTESWEQIRIGQGRPVPLVDLKKIIRCELSTLTEPHTVARALRRLKRREILRIAYGDIVSNQTLETVVTEISNLADSIIDAALCSSIARVTSQRGIPQEASGQSARMAVVALGKLGGRELNYSSDIDLVFVYSADGREIGARGGTNQEFFDRVARDTIRLLSDSGDLGIAYRVDMRLRPEGAAGPLIMSLENTLEYFDQFGRTWQRQAWVKARPVGGDIDLGRQLIAALEPWIFRRWLSHADIAGIKALKRRIEHRAQRECVNDRDVKHGRGGIRDVEFTVLFLQLLNGGDLPSVRGGNTVQAMRHLAQAGSLTDQELLILERSYTLLRKVEHRLQILFDRQTHLLPELPEEFSQLAVRTGYPPGAEGVMAFTQDMTEATTLNRRILDHLLHDAFGDEEAPEIEVDLVLDPDPSPAFIREVLERHLFQDRESAYRNLVSLGEEKICFLSTRRCRHFLAAIAPKLLRAISKTPDPDATLVTLARVSESLGGKGVLWELFSFHPPSLELYVNVCASSPFLAGILVSNPGMIDELLDSLLVGRLPTPEELDAHLRELCRNAIDIEPIIHSFKASQQLRVGVRDILGKQDVTTTSRALSAIAETILRVIVEREEAKLIDRLGEPMTSQGDSLGTRAGLVVLAMGKFGGREMNYHSDMDVVFLFDHDGSTFHPRRSRRSTDSTTNAHFFGELAQRIIKTFNAMTAHGRLYEMDSRLRPSGRSGSLAVSMDDFERYFSTDGPAADSERQSLVKARIVVSTRPARQRVEQCIEAATIGHSWTREAIEGIRSMRYQLEEGAKKSNLKRGPGGIVDLEFIVQTMQLVYGNEEKSLAKTETLSGLMAIYKAGKLSKEHFDFFETAYRVLRSIEGRLRLLNAAARHEFPESEEEQQKLAHLLGYQQKESLVEDVEILTKKMRHRFEEVFGDLALVLPSRTIA